MPKNFQHKRDKYFKGTNIFEKEISYKKSIEETKSESFWNNVDEWASYYRANPHRFAEDYLNFKFKLFQKFIFFAMFFYVNFVYIAARAQGKSLLIAVYCCVRAILYPGTKIVIAAGTKGQAMRIITEKIALLISQSSNLKREIKDIKTSLQNVDYNVLFHNDSTITVVASNQKARSLRSHVNVYEEFRQIDKEIIDSVLSKFRGSTREPPYLRKEKYKDYPREENQEIYLSSAWYKSHWSWETTKSAINGMLHDKGDFCCCLSYIASLYENIISVQQVKRDMEKDDFSPTLWSMEMEALFFGEHEKSYFKHAELLKIRKQVYPIYPKPFYDFLSNKKQIKYKKKEIHQIGGEQMSDVRLICCDISAVAGRRNDATILLIMDLIPTENGYRRIVPYMESYVGAHTGYQAIRIRQLFEDFDCDYIVLDVRNLGVGIYDALCSPLGDPERGVQYEPYVSMNDPVYKERSPFSDADEKIYTIAATSQLNNDIAVELRDTIQKQKLHLLKSENDSLDILPAIEGYMEFPVEIQALFMAPYKQTDELINEMINLETEKTSTNLIRLDEGSGRKDRYVALAYGNYFANILEREHFKNKSKFNWLDYFVSR